MNPSFPFFFKSPLWIINKAQSNQGMNIACVNMKDLLDKEFKVDKFYYDEFKLQYFDQDLYFGFPLQGKSINFYQFKVNHSIS